MTNQDYTKICSKCKEEKNIELFSKEKLAKDGFKSKCKQCRSKENQEYGKTKEGLVTRIYSNMKVHSMTRGDSPPEFKRDDLRKWLFSHNDFDFLFTQWIGSGFDKNKTPSCDRLDDYQGYSLDRLRLVTWKENNEKGQLDKVNGVNNKKNISVIQLSKFGSFIAEHYSIKQAARNVCGHFSNISACCSGRKKTAYGYRWVYKCTK